MKIAVDTLAVITAVVGEAEKSPLIEMTKDAIIVASPSTDLEVENVFSEMFKPRACCKDIADAARQTCQNLAVESNYPPSVRLWHILYAISQSISYYAEILQNHLPELRKQYKVRSLGLFGSYVRGQQQADSDLDVQVNFSELPSLFQFINLEDRLKELTGLEIDLVMVDGLKPNIGKRVLKEVVRL